MFKFPLSFLNRESEIPVDYDKLMKWLEEQGFEIASLVELSDDKLIEIEVKANRPDMLYVLGVLREYYSACCIPTPKSCKADMGFVYDSAVQPFGHKIRILSPDVHTMPSRLRVSITPHRLLSRLPMCSISWALAL